MPRLGRGGSVECESSDQASGDVAVADAERALSRPVSPRSRGKRRRRVRFGLVQTVVREMPARCARSASRWSQLSSDWLPESKCETGHAAAAVAAAISSSPSASARISIRFVRARPRCQWTARLRHPRSRPRSEAIRGGPGPRRTFGVWIAAEAGRSTARRDRRAAPAYHWTASARERRRAAQSRHARSAYETERLVARSSRTGQCQARMRGSTQKSSTWKWLVLPPATKVNRTRCHPGRLEAGRSSDSTASTPLIAVELAGVLRARSRRCSRSTRR